MRVGFQEFTEMVERCCCNSWRSAIGRANEDVIDRVSSILFTMEEGESWKYSFAVRIDGKWKQASAETAPVEFDPLGDDRGPSPDQQASALATEIMMGVSSKAVGL